MLSRLVLFALSQRMFVVFATAVLALAGGYAFRVIPIDAFPNISPVQVKMILKAPGMTPEEVETRVITPIEIELLGIPGQTILRSAAKYALADITLDFTDGTDIYWARQQVAERLSAVRGDLPETVTGGLAPVSTPLSDILMFTIEGGTLSLEERRSLLDWTIRPQLRTIPGVADVNALGGFVKTYEISPDTAALAAAGLSVSDISDAIEQGNRNDGAGRLSEGEKALVVRAQGAIRTPQDVEQIVLKTGLDGRVLRIGDVARVGLGSLTRYGAVTKDGTGEAVEGLVLALRGADASEVVARVRERIEAISKGLPEGVHLKVFYDRSDLIGSAVGTVRKALLEATVLVVVLLLLFLGDLRAALVVAVTLPLAALVTFLVMYRFGMSANLMSLGGLAIAIGLIVDASVVVVENAVERLQQQTSTQVPTLHTIFKSTTEVAAPVAAGILIICLVFLPLLSLDGIEGKLFSPVALTIVFALSGSLILSLTLIPVLASFLLKSGAHGEPLLMRLVMGAYRPLLRATLRFPYPAYAVAAAGLLLMVAAYGDIGKSFMPSMDEGAIILQVTKHPSINLEASVKGDLLIQKTLLEKIPEVDHIIARVGSDELGLDPMGLNETDMFFVLKPKSEWRVPNKEWLVDQLRTETANLPGYEFAFTQPIEMRTAEMLTGARGDLAVKIFGPDLAELSRVSGDLQKLLSSVPGAAEVQTVANDTVDYLEFDIDRLRAGHAGLSASRLEDELRAILEGRSGGVVTELARRTPIVIRGAQDVRDSPDLFAKTQLAAPAGGLVRAEDVATIKRVAGPVKIDRENASRYAIVQAYVSGRDLVGFVEEAQQKVANELKLPQGYRLVWGGQFENQRRAATRLSIVVPMALGMIFVVLFVTLRSVGQSVLIIANIPFALVGGVLALWISGEYLSVPASVGFIALLGIAVLNGLVLVSHFNELLASGVALETAVYEGAIRRLRPVLMTASIAALGLVPLLFATGPGSEIQRPLAIVVVGGLVTSTALTLILLPALFRTFGVGRTARAELQGQPQWINRFAS